ncbi:MAG: hypothetical protein H7235_02910 [Bdellovibrionaceae bacterium]|nr:hypothetical protein [Pseudobdellovibrionaceae bacterium]
MQSSNTNNLSNIFINIIIPVLILNKGAKLGLTALQALLIALAFPLINGVYSLIKDKKINFISVLGLANILFSGILTLLALGGIWFAFKEAIFPLLIGVFVFASSRSKKPFFETMFLNPSIFQLDKLDAALDTDEKKKSFEKLIIQSTQYLSASFLLSATLNFGLSLYIFTPLSEDLSIEQKQQLLNEQLSHMTAYSMIVILVPTLIFVGFIMYNAFKKMTALTGLKMDDLMVKSTPDKV